MAENDIPAVDLVRGELSLAQTDIEAVGDQAAKQHDQLQNAPQMLAELLRHIDEATLLTQGLRRLCGNNGIQAHFSMRAVDARNRVNGVLQDSSSPAAGEVVAAVTGLLDKQYNLEDLVSYDRLGNSGLFTVLSHLQDAKSKLEDLQNSGFAALLDATADVRDHSKVVKSQIEGYKDVL